jgi:hypothetical protein
MNKTTCQIELEELRLCLFPIKQAQSFLEEKYPEWTQAGKDYAVKEAAQYLRKAHARLNKIYVDTIYPPDPSTETESPPDPPEPWIGNCSKCRTAYRTNPKTDTSKPLLLNCGRPGCDGIVRFTPIDGIKEPECDPDISNLQETLPLPSELPEDYRYAKFTMKAADKLRAYWSKQEDCLEVWHPLGMQTCTDANWIIATLDADVIAELERRGYDKTTLRFSIEPQAGNPRFASQRPGENAESIHPESKPNDHE